MKNKIRVSTYDKIVIGLICVLLILWSLLLSGVITVRQVEYGSMEPTIHDKSIVVGVGSSLVNYYEKGDVIIFKKDGVLMIKRIIACAGEIADCIDGQRVVPDGCYYVLGDNRNISYDSRYWTEPFVPKEDILSKVILPSVKIEIGGYDDAI